MMPTAVGETVDVKVKKKLNKKLISERKKNVCVLLLIYYLLLIIAMLLLNTNDKSRPLSHVTATININNITRYNLIIKM